MRPKTANHRTCTKFFNNIDFIDDKERSTIPGPGNYEDDGSRMTGKNFVSKFKSVVLGGSAMLNKSERFSQLKSNIALNTDLTPSSWEYNTKYVLRGKGGKIGKQNRSAFTEKAARSSVTPGPGNYKLPT